MISVVVPTIRGREEHLARCLAAYESRTRHPLELIVEHDHPAVGPAWNAGAEKATGDYLHFTADDLEPHDGWDIPAVEAVDEGIMPAPRILNQHGVLDTCGEHGHELPEGTLVLMSVIPFMTWRMWELIRPVLPIHYYTDDWISWRASQAGFRTEVRRGFQFTHHWAEVGRGAGMSYEERMNHDRQVFIDAVRAAQRTQVS